MEGEFVKPLIMAHDPAFNIVKQAFDLTTCATRFNQLKNSKNDTK